MSDDERPAIRFHCPNCGKRLKAPAASAGQTVTCPACQTACVCPDPVPPAEPDPATVVAVHYDDAAEPDRPPAREDRDDPDDRPCPRTSRHRPYRPEYDPPPRQTGTPFVGWWVPAALALTGAMGAGGLAVLFVTRFLDRLGTADAILLTAWVAVCTSAFLIGAVSGGLVGVLVLTATGSGGRTPRGG